MVVSKQDAQAVAALMAGRATGGQAVRSCWNGSRIRERPQEIQLLGDALAGLLPACKMPQP
jgi:hypothetical protein